MSDDDFMGRPLARAIPAESAEALAKHLGIHTVGQLLHHYPRRYSERGAVVPVAGIREGDPVTIEAEVVKSESRAFKNRRGSLQEITIADRAGTTLRLTFFNQVWRVRQLHVGARGFFTGTVGLYKPQPRGPGRTPPPGVIQLVHPHFMAFKGAEEDDAFRDDLEFLIPIYPASAHISTLGVMSVIRTLLEDLPELPDPLPAPVRRAHGFMGLTEALQIVHRPRDKASAARAKDRLRFDEAFVLQVALAQGRAAVRRQPATPRRPRPGGLLEAFDASLPFELTKGQIAVAAEIEAGLAREYPMHRLLQGEVGSGKTVVALRAMLTVADAGGQSAFLAPTEVLAQQHHRNLRTLLGALGAGGELGAADVSTRIALLTGSMGAAARRRALLDAQSGDAGIVVGTHALLEERVGFADLGLVVVDEQHRFGVEQRDALRAKGERPPHLLVMTATPIPRTVAMTVFGDLETSTLTELPLGRAPITTHVVPTAEKPHYLERAWDRIREEVGRGHQVFVVCPRIGDEEGEEGAKPRRRPKKPAGEEAAAWDDEEGGHPPAPGRQEPEKRPPLAVIDILPMLEAGPLAGLRVEPLHGRLAPDVKEQTMLRFASGDVDVLVATTVVEVGVDVPNATVMAILDADRFGVSQLHQLRGRIGRGSAPGLCLLVTDAPPGSEPLERLAKVAQTTDGFELSRLDLETRREGDVLGASQSGSKNSLRLLKVIEDEELIALAREAATEVVDADPELAGHPALAAALQVLLEPEKAEFLEKA